MEFQEWYKKHEKELYEEFANVNGENFHFFCDREFEESIEK